MNIDSFSTKRSSSVFVLIATSLVLTGFIFLEEHTYADSKVTLSITFANDTSQPYTISVVPQEKYTISQSYSWVRDQSSRFNLQAYSIDNGPYVHIPRVARGNFTLDVPTDTNHSIVFLSQAQYPIEVNGTDSFTFLPPSPTGDNWFDINSNVQVSVPHIIKSDKENSRVQLNGWSFDGRDIQSIARQESGYFTTSPIQISSPHTVDFVYVQQFYLNVVSEFGHASGSGWYYTGTTASASVTLDNNFPIRHLFSGWTGATQSSMESVNIVVNGPSTLTANWSLDYSPIAILGAVVAGIAIGSLTIYARRKKITKPPKTEERPVQIPQRTEIQADNLAGIDQSYSREVDDYLLQKSLEKLDSFKAAGILSDTRHSNLKGILSRGEPF